MARDDGRGRMSLDHDRLRLDWPGVASQDVFARVGERLTEATAANGGRYVRNPLRQLTR